MARTSGTQIKSRLWMSCPCWFGQLADLRASHVTGCRQWQHWLVCDWVDLDRQIWLLWFCWHPAPTSLAHHHAHRHRFRGHNLLPTSAFWISRQTDQFDLYQNSHGRIATPTNTICDDLYGPPAVWSDLAHQSGCTGTAGTVATLHDPVWWTKFSGLEQSQ